MAYIHVVGLFFQTIPHLGKDPPPPLKARGIIDPPQLGRLSWSGVWRVRLWTDRSVARICLVLEHFDSLPPPVVHDWVIKGLGMSIRVCVTG